MLVVVDGACDLSPTARERSDVTVVPFEVDYEGSPFFGAGKAFADLLRSGARLTTSPPNDRQFTSAFGEQREIVVLATSTQLSAAMDAATVAARSAYADVRVVDTRTFSAGTGLVLDSILDLLAEGGSASDLGAMYEMVVESVHTYALVDNSRVLLGHGLLGRSHLSRWRRPVVSIRGRARLLRQARSRHSAQAFVIHHAREAFAGPPTAWAVAHVGAGDIDRVVATCRDAFELEPRFVTEMNPTAAIHLGPEAVVVAFSAP